MLLIVLSLFGKVFDYVTAGKNQIYAKISIRIYFRFQKIIIKIKKPNDKFRFNFQNYNKQLLFVINNKSSMRNKAIKML